nr:Peptidase incomplete domain containing protein [Pandoravirus belohorizontensis]
MVARRLAVPRDTDGRVDAAAALAERGLVLPDHFDGRRKWRRLLAPQSRGSVSARDECARALADRVAIMSRGAVVVDLVAPHPDETEPRGDARSPSLVALHRDQYVWGARESGQPPEAARRVKSIAYYRPTPPDDGNNDDRHLHVASRHNDGARRRDRFSDAVCAEIYLRGPVTTAIDVHEDLAWPEAYATSWIGGIYAHRADAQPHHVTSPGRLGAAVVSLVGWSTDADTGRRYYLVRGGPATRLSPHDGVFCMWARQCGIEEHAVAALPDLWGLRLPARFLHDAAPGDAVPGAAQRARDLRAAVVLHPSGHTRAFVASLPPADRLALAPLVDPAHLPADHAAFVAGRARNPHEAPGAHDAP